VIQPVQLQVSGAQLQPRLPLAPQQGSAARPQLMQTEWLHHQVVGPKIEAADPRVNLLPGGKHQNRQIEVEQANLDQRLFAVLNRHVEVENGEVGHLLAERLHGLRSVVDQPNPMPICLQAAT
jgi:hypothetical protein